MSGFQPTSEGVVSFLNDRLSEDEAVAREAGQSTWARSDEQSRMFVLDDNYRHDKIVISSARVLADVAAKRAILAFHRDRPGGGCTTCYDMDYAPPETDTSDWMPWPCPTVKALIQSYADHPDFDPAWKVGDARSQPV